MNPETAIIGSIILSQGKALDMLTISPDEFNDLKLGRIYGELRAMKSNREPIDPISVTSKFPEHLTDIYEWQYGTPTWENVDFYEKIVRDNAIRRELVNTASSIANASKEDDLDKVLDTARGNLTQLAERRAQGRVEYISQLALTHLDTINQPRTYMPGPWDKLNVAINGFRPGAMYVIGARPGVGKTVVGLQIAYHLSKTGPVTFHSLEMSKTELLNRIYSMTAGVYLGNLEKGTVKDFEWAKLAAAKDELTESQLAIVDKGTQTLNDIRAHARSVEQNGGLKAIVVDYLGLIHDTVPGRKRYESISDFSVQLKAIARDFEVPVIALAQLNRQSENRVDKAPALSDLRDSGAIEQDADVVMLLRREKRDGDREWENSKLVMDVAKNRHGMTGEIELVFNGGCARVENAETANERSRNGYSKNQ